MLIGDEAKPVEREELVLGQAVPWRIFDRDMRLLLREGTVITSERQIDALLMRGALRYEVVEPQTRAKLRELHQQRQQAEARATDPFRPFHELAESLEQVFDIVVADPQALRGQIFNLRRIAKQLFEQVKAQPELAIAVVHLVHEYRYPVIHPIHCAILLALIELRDQAPWSHSEAVLCAALSQNLGMNAYQDELDKSAKLSDAQRDAVRRHPTVGVEMLERAGVEDELWLTMVVQHHEQADGRGYPFNMPGDLIEDEAMLLSLADRYSALLSERGDREGSNAQAVIKQLYQESRFGEDPLYMRLLRELSANPPGTFVRLRSGETAHVVSRSGESGKPLVVAYLSPRGIRLDPPRLRDTGTTHYEIKAPCQVDIEAFNMREVWEVVQRYRRND